eukprot:5964770-Pyramimonas_sp.AAC.1
MRLSPSSAAYTRFKHLEELHGSPWSAYQKWCCGRALDSAGPTIMLIRGVEVPNMAFWHDSR